ncbi:MAG: hypothetical protein AABY22_31820 [Nanoarchaeota archaeon]
MNNSSANQPIGCTVSDQIITPKKSDINGTEKYIGFCEHCMQWHAWHEQCIFNFR